MTRGRQILTAAAIALGALVYGASPFDIVPEFLAGPLGFGDDAVVLVGAGIAIWQVLRRRRAVRVHARRTAQQPQGAGTSGRG